MTTLYIFGYGEDQLVENKLNKKFNNSTLLYHNDVVNLINKENYLSIMYFNNKLSVNYLDKEFEEIEITDELFNKLNLLIDEIRNK